MLDIASVLEPFILRRLKNDVLKDLPKKSEVILYHGLSAVQMNYYKAILRKDVGESFISPAFTPR